MAITRLGSNQSVNLASNVTGTLPVANGGTAITSGFVNGEKNLPYFARYNNTQSVANATETLLQFTGSIVDNGSAWDSSNYRWVPQTAGKYYVYSYGVQMNDADYDISQIRIRKNGSTRIAESQIVQRFYDTHFICAMVDLNGSSDYVDCTSYHEYSPGTNFGNNQIYVSNFGGWLVSAT